MTVSREAERSKLFERAAAYLNSATESISAAGVNLDLLKEEELPKSVEEILWRLNSAASYLAICRAKVIEATSPDVLSEALHSMLSS